MSIAAMNDFNDSEESDYNEVWGDYLFHTALHSCCIKEKMVHIHLSLAE